MRPIPDPAPGKPLYAENLKAQLRELVRQGQFHVEGGTLDSSSTGVALSVDPPTTGFWARLTAPTGTLYGWVEQQLRPDRTWQDLPNGRVGSSELNPAQATDGSTAVPVGTVAYLHPDRSDVTTIGGNRYSTTTYVFEAPFPNYCGSGSGSGPCGLTVDVVVGMCPIYGDDPIHWSDIVDPPTGLTPGPAPAGSDVYGSDTTGATGWQSLGSMLDGLGGVSGDFGG